jgi:hypothetical protein
MQQGAGVPVPPGTGTLRIACDGDEGVARYGYSYTTTSHLNVVRVPEPLSVRKESGEVVRFRLVDRGDHADVIGVE